MFCMAKICSPTYLRIIGCTRLTILNTVVFHWDGFGLLTLTLKHVSPKKLASFLPAMASNYTSMNYYRAFSKNRCIYNLLAMWLSAQMCWQWAGPKLQSLLSAHCLIGTYFLTTESGKGMCLLIRHYGMAYPGHTDSMMFCTFTKKGPLAVHLTLDIDWGMDQVPLFPLDA